MYPTSISAPIARRGVMIFLLLVALASALALSGCDVLSDASGSEKSGPNTDTSAERDEGDASGEQHGDALSRQTSGENSAPAMTIDLSIRYQWVGQIVLSELRGIELTTDCGNWALTFESPELEAKAANSAGLQVTVWGLVKGLEEGGARQVIAVDSVFASDDPMPKILIPSYPCGGETYPVDPDYPVTGPIEIDLLPGEIAAVGKLVKTDDGRLYLETESGRILLRIPESVPPVRCEDPGDEIQTLPAIPEDMPLVDCVEVDPTFEIPPMPPEDTPLGEPQRDEVLPEPGSTDSGGGVDGSTGSAGSGGTVSGGPAPSTVDSAPSPIMDDGTNETIVVGTWSMEDGQLVIDVRYFLDRSYVYPRPITPPEPMPTPVGGEAGYITGQVAIGPLCPVEPCTEPAPDVYSKHVVVLESEDGAQIEVPLYDGGYFRAEVKPGTYVVTLSNCEYMGCSAALPVRVEVKAGALSELMIDIDTGIR